MSHVFRKLHSIIEGTSPFFSNDHSLQQVASSLVKEEMISQKIFSFLSQTESEFEREYQEQFEEKISHLVRLSHAVYSEMVFRPGRHFWIAY
jgi:hypothetical protein